MSTLAQRIQPALDIRDESLEPTAMLPNCNEALPQNVMGIPRSSGLMTSWELSLTENYDATALVRMLKDKQVSAQTLLTAFRKRATIAQQCTNCLTELIPQALEDARACDEYLERTGRTLGPLHGLPISVKEQISIAGRYTNVGFVSLVNNLSGEDAHIVKSLKELGAVVFARTNQPQSLMQLETSNNIYGVTVNPRNRGLTAGGSTGGEGALMGMKGSPLGIGGDIGGSIRVPAALNGVYGFYPSIGRVSGEGALIPTPGCDSIPGTLGPFTRSVRDIELFCKAYSLVQPWMNDVSLIPGDILSMESPLRPGKAVRVGIIADDGVVSPFPPVRYVIAEVRKALEKDPRIEMVSFSPFNHAEGWRIIAANYFEDGGADIREWCKKGGEPLLPLTEWILNECEESSKAVSSTMQGRKTARDQFRQKYNAHWNKAGVDVVLAPVTPNTAPPLGATPYWGYTAIWNLLQYPAITFPASSFIRGWDRLDLSGLGYQPKNEKEEKMLEDYSPAVSQGLPVGLQVVAKRMQEDTLLQATYIIEEALQCSTRLNSL